MKKCLHLKRPAPRRKKVKNRKPESVVRGFRSTHFHIDEWDYPTARHTIDRQAATDLVLIERILGAPSMRDLRALSTLPSPHAFVTIAEDRPSDPGTAPPSTGGKAPL